MDGAPRSRLTVALVVVTIVAVLALLVAGALLAPGTEPVTEVEETSLGSAPTVPGAVGPTTTVVHVHEGNDEVAVATTPDAVVVQADHDDHAAHEDHATTVIVIPATGAVEHDHGATHDDIDVTIPAGHHHDATTTTTTTTVPRPATTIPSVTTTTTVPALTDDEQTLLTATFAGLTRFGDEASLLAAGYVSSGDAASGYEHLVNAAYLDDGNELDPLHIEEVVLDATGAIVAGVYVTGDSTLHVWLVPQPCGQLAPIEVVLAGC